MMTIAKLIGYAAAIIIIGWSVYHIIEVVQTADDRIEIQIRSAQ